MQYIKDYAQTHKKTLSGKLKPGTGQIVIDKKGRKVAVYRDSNNHLQTVSAVCTHMKCIVHWNNAEHTWDCPCHGSRFKTDGTVIEGPAYKDLQKI